MFKTLLMFQLQVVSTAAFASLFKTQEMEEHVSIGRSVS